MSSFENKLENKATVLKGESNIPAKELALGIKKDIKANWTELTKKPNMLANIKHVSRGVE